MASKTLLELTLDTPAATDLLYYVKNPGGTPLDRATTLTTLGTALSALLTPIAANQIAFATATNTLGGDAGFTFDPTASSRTVIIQGSDSFLVGLNVEADLTPIVDGTESVIGSLIEAYSDGTKILRSVKALDINVGHFSSGTASTLIGIEINGDNFGGVLTEFNGLLIGDITGATNNYAIKTGAGMVSFGDGGLTFDPATDRLVVGTDAAESTARFGLSDAESFDEGAFEIGYVDGAFNTYGVGLRSAMYTTAIDPGHTGNYFTMFLDVPATTASGNPILAAFEMSAGGSASETLTSMTAVNIFTNKGSISLGTLTALNIDNVAGATNNYAIKTGTGPVDFGSEVRAGGDVSGAASRTTLTNATNTTLTNAYAVKGGQIATTANTGWIKIYVGTAVSWVPYWTNATP